MAEAGEVAAVLVAEIGEVMTDVVFLYHYPRRLSGQPLAIGGLMEIVIWFFGVLALWMCVESLSEEDKLKRSDYDWAGEKWK